MKVISLKPSVANSFKSTVLCFQSPYGMGRQELVDWSKKAADILMDLLKEDEQSSLLQVLKEDFKMFRIDGCPLDNEIGDTPISPNTSIPPNKGSFVFEWFTMAVENILGFQPWNQGDFHNGVYLQNVCRRNGHEGNATSRGGAELTWHCDNPVAPPKFIALACERPSKKGGVTHFVDTVSIVKSLPSAVFAELCKHSFEFDTIAGGNYADESARNVVPIVETTDGIIKVVRLQSRKNSIVGLTQEADDALVSFRKAVATATRFTTVWERGMILFAANAITAHMRTEFHQPDSDPTGRWLTKFFGE